MLNENLIRTIEKIAELEKSIKTQNIDPDRILLSIEPEEELQQILQELEKHSIETLIEYYQDYNSDSYPYKGAFFKALYPLMELYSEIYRQSKGKKELIDFDEYKFFPLEYLKLPASEQTSIDEKKRKIGELQKTNKELEENLEPGDREKYQNLESKKKRLNEQFDQLKTENKKLQNVWDNKNKDQKKEKDELKKYLAAFSGNEFVRKIEEVL